MKKRVSETEISVKMSFVLHVRKIFAGTRHFFINFLVSFQKFFLSNCENEMRYKPYYAPPHHYLWGHFRSFGISVLWSFKLFFQKSILINLIWMFLFFAHICINYVKSHFKLAFRIFLINLASHISFLSKWKHPT